LKPTPPPEADLVPLATGDRKKKERGKKKQDGEEKTEQPDGKGSGKSWKRKGTDGEEEAGNKGDKKGDKKGGKRGSEMSNGGSMNGKSEEKGKGKGKKSGKGQMLTLEEVEARMTQSGGESTKGKGKGKKGKGKGKYSDE
jgi:hypothetical protein